MSARVCIHPSTFVRASGQRTLTYCTQWNRDAVLCSSFSLIVGMNRGVSPTRTRSKRPQPPNRNHRSLYAIGCHLFTTRHTTHDFFQTMQQVQHAYVTHARACLLVRSLPFVPYPPQLGSDESELQIVREGGLAPILEGATSSNVELQSQCARALRNLSVNREQHIILM